MAISATSIFVTRATTRTLRANGCSRLTRSLRNTRSGIDPASESANKCEIAGETAKGACVDRLPLHASPVGEAELTIQLVTRVFPDSAILCTSQAGGSSGRSDARVP